MLISDVLVWDDELDAQVYIGSIKTDGKKIILSFPKGTADDDKEMVRRTAREEITGPDGNLINPRKDPKLFVKNLAVTYGNIWFSATVAREE